MGALYPLTYEESDNSLLGSLRIGETWGRKTGQGGPPPDRPTRWGDMGEQAILEELVAGGRRPHPSGQQRDRVPARISARFGASLTKWNVRSAAF